MKSEPTMTSGTFLTLSYFPPKLYFIHFSSLIVSVYGSDGAASELVEG